MCEEITLFPLFVDYLIFLVGGQKFATFADNQGQTPLHWATQRNQLACVRLLLDSGASLRPIHVRIHFTNYNFDIAN